METSSESRGKKVIVFDLDGTLAESKSPLTSSMSELLCRLLEKYYVSIISGGAFPQFKKQIIDTLKEPSDKILSKLILFPTTGSSLYTYKDKSWICEYEELLNEKEKLEIIDAWQKAIEQTRVQLPETTYGPVIEDRKTQMSFSACGQLAPIEVKSIWDIDQAKRKKIQGVMSPLIPDFSINFGGTNTIDVTRSGVDKAYALEKLKNYLNILKTDIIFIGDKLEAGGNDHPAITYGVECISVSNPNETEVLIKNLIREQ